MKFVNNKSFKRQNIELLSGGLKVCKKNLFDSVEYETSYEQIGHKLKVESTINNNLLFTGICFIVIGVLFLFGTFYKISPVLIFIGSLFCVITFIAKKRIITILCFDGNNIELHFTKQNKAEVIQFANQIISSANNFLLNKYSKVDRALPLEDQLNNLNFLRNREIITEDSFENLKNQLLGRENTTSIGFNS